MSQLVIQVHQILCLQEGQGRAAPFLLGCLLFILEPLAQSVRDSHVIPAIIIKGKSHHISFHADDILLHVADVANSVPHVLNLFPKFGSFLGYKIHWSKLI